jgi:hypothetical protein
MASQLDKRLIEERLIGRESAVNIVNTTKVSPSAGERRHA